MTWVIIRGGEEEGEEGVFVLFLLTKKNKQMSSELEGHGGSGHY